MTNTKLRDPMECGHPLACRVRTINDMKMDSVGDVVRIVEGL